MMNGTTVTGYLYGGETCCAACIYDLFLPFDLTTGPKRSTEDVLDYVARQRGINRYDENSYSSDQFPHPMYLSDTNETDVCVLCGRRLLNGPIAS